MRQVLCLDPEDQSPGGRFCSSRGGLICMTIEYETRNLFLHIVSNKRWRVMDGTSLVCMGLDTNNVYISGAFPSDLHIGKMYKL